MRGTVWRDQFRTHKGNMFLPKQNLAIMLGSQTYRSSKTADTMPPEAEHRLSDRLASTLIHRKEELGRSPFLCESRHGEIPAF